MSLPNYQFSSEPVLGQLLDPRNKDPVQLFSESLGPVALNDPSQGLEYQIWRVNLFRTLNGNSYVYLSSASYPETLIYSGLNIINVSLSFDQNGTWALSFEQDNIAKLYWFDTTIPGYSLLSFGTDSHRPQIFLDKTKYWNIAQSSIVLFYTKAGVLYYRDQSDRFTIERNPAFAGTLIEDFITEPLSIDYHTISGSPSFQYDSVNSDFSILNTVGSSDLVSWDKWGYFATGSAWDLDISLSTNDTHIGFFLPADEGFNGLFFSQSSFNWSLTRYTLGVAYETVSYAIPGSFPLNSLFNVTISRSAGGAFTLTVNGTNLGSAVSTFYFKFKPGFFINYLNAKMTLHELQGSQTAVDPLVATGECLQLGFSNKNRIQLAVGLQDYPQGIPIVRITSTGATRVTGNGSRRILEDQEYDGRNY
jgi:hypothetical protein